MLIVIGKKDLINILVQESERGALWGPLTEKGAKKIIKELLSSDYEIKEK